VAQQTTADEIAALERVRAEIELALSSNPDWLAFRRGGTGRQLAELALAGNPLYKSWDLLNEAIRDFQAKGARQRGADTGPPRDDLTRIRGIGPALAQRLAERGTTTFAQIAAWGPDEVREVAEALDLGRKISGQNWIEQAALLDLSRRAGAAEVAQPGSLAGADVDPRGEGARPRVPHAARKIKLADVLESIRNDAALRGTKLPSVVLDGQQPEAAPLLGQEQPPAARNSAPGPDSVARVVFEPEEATVTFVIRESVEPASDLARERDAQLGPRSPDSAVSAAASPAGPPDSGDGEAEVVIVAGAADRASRAASRKR